MFLPSGFSTQFRFHMITHVRGCINVHTARTMVPEAPLPARRRQSISGARGGRRWLEVARGG